jgi:hypothetical protein
MSPRLLAGLALLGALSGCGGRGGEAEWEFAEYGSLGAAGEVGGDARHVLSVTREPRGDTARVVIAFARADSTPATGVGIVHGEIVRDEGFVRVWLPDEVQGALAVQDLAVGPIAGPVYVVRSLDGPWFVDIHLAAPARARLDVAHDPAAAVVDLVRGGEPLPAPAAFGPNAVLLAPRAGEVFGDLEITGYARTFEASVSVRLHRDGRAIADTFTTAADYVYAWGEFRARLAAPAPGPCSLFVGEPVMEGGAGYRGAGARLVAR